MSTFEIMIYASMGMTALQIAWFVAVLWLLFLVAGRLKKIIQTMSEI